MIRPAGGPLRAVRIVRVSKARDDMVSPELQDAAIDAFEARRGLVTVARLEGLDESGSGAGSRWWAKLDEAIGYVERGEADAIVAWKFSRAARHRLRWAVAVDRVESAGGQLLSATEDIDTTTSTGRFTRGMLAEIAAWEAERIGEGWREAHARRRRMGRPAQGGDRFGYLRDGDTYLPDPVTGPVLAQMYADYIGGRGFARIGFALNDRGIRTLAGGVWARDRVTAVMDSGFAAGLIRQGRRRRSTYLPGAHEPIIDEATWETYLAVRRRRAPVPARTVEPRYPLTGLIVCGDCLAPMHPTRLGVGAGHGYQCSTWAQKGGCRCVTVTRAKAERAAKEHIAMWAADVEARAELIDVRARAHADAQAQIRAARRDLAAAERALEKAAHGWATERIDDRTYAETRGRLADDRDVAQKRLDEATELEAARAVPPVRTARRLLEGWDTLPVATRRDLLAVFIARVRVVRGERRGEVTCVIDPR